MINVWTIFCEKCGCEANVTGMGPNNGLPRGWGAVEFDKFQCHKCIDHSPDDPLTPEERNTVDVFRRYCENTFDDGWIGQSILAIIDRLAPKPGGGHDQA